MRRATAFSWVAFALALASGGSVALAQPDPSLPNGEPTAPPPVEPPAETQPVAPAEPPPDQTAPPHPSPPSPPAYPQQPYPQQAGPGPGPPAPPPPKKSTCCRFAIRFDPFDLLFRRLSFQGEVAIIGPLAIEVEPSWIWGSGADNVDAHGFAIAGNVAFYLTGRAPQGFFIKATAAYENFVAVVTNPDYKQSQASARIASPIFGGMIGSSTVFGKNWGFNISGGIGIGAATAGSQKIAAPGKGDIPAYVVKFYDKGSVIQLLGSLGLGIAF